MNSAYDNHERPHTPSFIGSYSSVDDSHPYLYGGDAPHPAASYVYGRNAPKSNSPHVYGRDAPRRTTIISTSASTVGFLPSEKKKRRNQCGRSCILLILLALFIILSIVMTVLYILKPSNAGKENENKNGGDSQKTTVMFQNRQSIP